MPQHDQNPISPLVASPTVDLIFNCYQKSLAKVLDANFINTIANSNLTQFSGRYVLINNVDDRSQATEMAQAIKNAGLITDFVFVEDYLQQCLKDLGLRAKTLGRIPYYSDWALVAPFIAQSEYFVHWDADVELVQAGNWIGPALAHMQADSSIFCANPMWSANEASIRAEAHQELADGFLSVGFSDQVYLVKTLAMRQPIYHYFHWASLRYPLYAIAAIFESRVDSYLRVFGKQRLTIRGIVYQHPREEEGLSYPKSLKISEKVRSIIFSRYYRLRVWISRHN